MKIFQLNTMILHDERKKFLFFFKSLVKGQDRSFFKDFTGVFCVVGSTLVVGGLLILMIMKNALIH
jgi:hypothetical protein